MGWKCASFPTNQWGKDMVWSSRVVTQIAANLQFVPSTKNQDSSGFSFKPILGWACSKRNLIASPTLLVIAITCQWTHKKHDKFILVWGHIFLSHSHSWTSFLKLGWLNTKIRSFLPLTLLFSNMSTQWKTTWTKQRAKAKPLYDIKCLSREFNLAIAKSPWKSGKSSKSPTIPTEIPTKCPTQHIVANDFQHGFPWTETQDSYHPPWKILHEEVDPQKFPAFSISTLW